jgi:hypothetical protein
VRQDVTTTPAGQQRRLFDVLIAGPFNGAQQSLHGSVERLQRLGAAPHDGDAMALEGQVGGACRLLRLDGVEAGRERPTKGGDPRIRAVDSEHGFWAG